MAHRLALVVDDSKTARVTLRRMLEQHNLDVDTLESAPEALDYLATQTPDVIFMDHMMPDMDGFEAVEAIKGNPDTATIPIMMYTSKEGDLYVSQARALGAIGILPKHVEPAELFEVLNSLGLARERRALRVAVRDLSWREEEDGATISFRLPAGAYATAVLREIVMVRDAAAPPPRQEAVAQPGSRGQARRSRT